MAQSHEKLRRSSRPGGISSPIAFAKDFALTRLTRLALQSPQGARPSWRRRIGDIPGQRQPTAANGVDFSLFGPL